MASEKLSPARRIVTGHDSNGNAIVISDTSPAMGVRPGSSPEEAKLHQSAIFWSTNVFPNDNNSSAFLEGTIQPSTKGGSILRMVEFAPGLSSPLHRTMSLDYAVLLYGNGVEMELDGGVCVRISPGDVIVQRGTIHAWHNRGTDWSRFLFVLMDACPIVIGGKELRDAGL
jgi:quercetin dioxygenase-like cupin family protein